MRLAIRILGKEERVWSLELYRAQVALTLLSNWFDVYQAAFPSPLSFRSFAVKGLLALEAES